MTQWATFVGLTGVVCILLLVLSHATKATLTETDSSGLHSNAGRSPRSGGDGIRESDRPDRVSPADRSESTVSNGDPEDMGVSRSDLDASGFEEVQGQNQNRDHQQSQSQARSRSRSRDQDTPLAESMSTGELLVNVAVSQGLFAAVLIGAAFYTAIPASALGIEFSTEYLVSGFVLGTGFGLVLYLANELGSATAKRLRIDHSEDLREMLAPSSAGGWVVLLVLVLPVIAIFEEFLFRAALIGAVSAGFDVSPWILAIVSSIAFALGHGMQGPAGIAVTGVLGLVLAAIFIYTGSFLVVVVAHYLVNALEFVVHEGFGLEWGDPDVDTETT